ncbi:hypothetical protein Syun_031410 [Stephania yunnanensis]|uniref:MADS-box domain-containing protein n=1 Tax=Stephania yunnanensis TaxID=152371 RepID=A0AAP0HEI3_9MAGN
MENAVEKSSTGRKKIPMKKIEKPEHLQVAFSKRRVGLFKKAHELCVLTGAKVAIIVFSPGDRPYSFGHPSVDSVLDEFLHNGNLLEEYDLLLELNQGSNINKLKDEYNELMDALQVENKKKEKLKKAIAKAKAKAKESDVTRVEKLELNELKKLKKSMEGIQKQIRKRIDEEGLHEIVNNRRKAHNN